MQAKLPDINAAIVRHRSQALEGFKNNEPEIAIVSLFAINALLPATPKNYKVNISTEKYNEEIAEIREIKCSKCGKNSFLNEVDEFEMELTDEEKLVTDRESQLYWVCTDMTCKYENEMSLDSIYITKKGEPYYFGVMPSPPSRQSGIKGRTTYLNEFQKWFSIAFDEIESQIGKYRADYAAQEDKEEVIIMGGDELVDNRTDGALVLKENDLVAS